MEYFCYSPNPQSSQQNDLSSQITKFNVVLDNAIKRSLNVIGENQVWVPLSGGLDSRLVLSKLKEHGCQNLFSFSYGAIRNFEARTARRIAKMLNVPWVMIPAELGEARQLSLSKIRMDYENFAYGFSSIPAYTEFQVFYHASKHKIIPKGAFIVNGQTGDFISGGHIPEQLFKLGNMGNENEKREVLLNYILDKHFSMWNQLKTEENLEFISLQIEKELVSKNNHLDNNSNLIRQYESFEWRERQAKIVVHGQRCYDFFGYNWTLPLWDSEIINFFEKLPFDQKYQQAFFRAYLKSYNYKGVFRTLSAKPENWRWFQLWIVLIAQVVGILLGIEAKKHFYKKMLFFGFSRFQYELFGKVAYMKNVKNLRNMISLSLIDFLERQRLFRSKNKFMKKYWNHLLR